MRSVSRGSGRCRVVVRGREIEVPLSELAAPAAPAAGTAGEKVPVQDVTAREVPGELNLMGQRIDPALSMLERYLNDASIAGLRSVRIVHGIGTGRLAAAVREYLEGHPLVTRFRRGGEEEGGGAVTVVYL